MSAAPDRGGLLALVADDDPDILTLVAYRLAQSGCEVLEATDGEEALRLAIERRPDLCVLDLKMPKLSGFEVTSAIRSEPACADTQILLLTASAEEADVARAEEAGVDDFLRKPFRPDELRAFVTAAIARRLDD